MFNRIFDFKGRQNRNSYDASRSPLSGQRKRAIKFSSQVSLFICYIELARCVRTVRIRITALFTELLPTNTVHPAKKRLQLIRIKYHG